jgi:phage replication-related protein YjqB (UPF0714/DUF867 family)
MITKISVNRFGIFLSKYTQKLGTIALGTILLFFLGSLCWYAPALADTFGCYQGTGSPAACTSSLPPLIGSECIANSGGTVNDWNTTIADNNSNVTALSFHGGQIEANTSPISEDLQELYGWNRYDFNGHVTTADCKSLWSADTSSCTVGRNFCTLHITSTRFNDNVSVNLVGAHPRAVAIHGCGSSGCSSSTICVGGRNVTTTQIVDFRNYVNTYKALVSGTLLTFNVPANTGDSGATCASMLAGENANNIVNRTSSNEGLQLEMSSDIRNRLASDDQEDDLLRAVVYGGIADAVGEPPLPLVSLGNTETYTANGKTFTKYNLNVENRSEYDSQLFAPAPTLPPCGSNTNSARTWVNIYNADNDQRIYGFCALSSPQHLNSIWFAVEQGQTPPASIYVSLVDRQVNTTYRSNRVQISI